MTVEFAWVTIPAGDFLMGTPDDEADTLIRQYRSICFRYETPQRSVHLETYEISKYPITNAQFRAFVEATGYQAGAWPWGYREEEACHPVTRVNLDDAEAFCEWANCRLPTEEEWEKAARGSEGLNYPWGNDWRVGHCNSREAGIRSDTTMHATTPVTQYPQGVSPYGIYDMAGNVWEWTSGWMSSASISAVWWAYRNPEWNSLKRGEWFDIRQKSEYESPVLRGGASDSNQIGCRTAFRLYGYPPYVRGDCFGFRCVRLA